MAHRSRFARTRDGQFKLRLQPDERALLATLPDQLEALLGSSESSEATTRLFPPAYAVDQALDAEYQRLMREELIRRRVEALDVIRDTIELDRLTGDQLDAWVRAINDARLVLGTLLDVTEDEDPLDVDPEAPDIHQRIAYIVLSAVVGDAVDALAGY